MKKLSLLSTVFILISSFSRAQSSEVVSAWNYLNDAEYENALTAINAASQDAKTTTWPKTWYYRGVIYMSIHDDSLLTKKHSEALQESITSYRKAMDLNPKNEFRTNIQSDLTNAAIYVFNEGVAPYNAKDYAAAYAAFKTSSDLYSYVNATFGTSLEDTLASRFAANAAVKLAKYDEAISIYSNLINTGFKAADIYANMSESYLMKGDTANAEKIVGDGVKMYPNDMTLRIQELNILIARGQRTEAIDKLKEAIQKQPDYMPLYMELGNQYELINDTAHAAVTYRDAIKAHPEMFDGYYRLGALYYNSGVLVNNKMKDIPDNQQALYDQTKTERDHLFTISLPYLEHASQLNPTDKETLIALKEIYARLNMMEKMEEVKKKLESMN